MGAFFLYHGREAAKVASMPRPGESDRLLAGSPMSYSINQSDVYAYSPDMGSGFLTEPTSLHVVPSGDEQHLSLASLHDDSLDRRIIDSETESDRSSHFEPHARKPFIPPSDSAMAYRMRYYNRLSTRGDDDLSQASGLQLPAHVVPSSLFFPSMRSIIGLVKTVEPEPEEPKQSDIKLIFSIWNTMMGSSILAMPWGLSEAGLGLGLGLIFLLGILCCYTATLIVRHGKDSADFFYLCNDYLGKWGKRICWFSSVAILFGGVIAYDILMSDILLASVNSLVNVAKNIADNPDFPTSATGTHYWWNDKVTPLLVLLVMFPICNMKKFGIIVTINSLGVISIMYTVAFIFAQCTFEQGLDVHEVRQVNSGAFILAGLLSISFYIHGMVLPIIKSAKNPQNNVRNVTIGFILVAVCYAIVGSVGYLAYWSDPDVPAIPQEFLQIYDMLEESTNPGVILANLLLLFQLATVFPLLLLIIRIQVFGLLLNSQYPGWMHVCGLNLALIGVATLFAIFYPNFGSILSVTGALFGTIIVFFLPIAVHLKAMKQKTGSWGFFRSTIHASILLFAVVVAVGQFVPWDLIVGDDSSST